MTCILSTKLAHRLRASVYEHVPLRSRPHDSCLHRSQVCII